MKALLLLGALSLSYAGLSNDSHACGRTRVYSMTDNGSKYELVLDGDAVAQTEVWAPTRGEPPLSVTQAATSVSDWARLHYPATDRSVIRAIALEQFLCSGVTYGHWYYRFDLTLISADGAPVSNNVFAAVLMDGTIVGSNQSK
jgi:hypothetical protein